MSDVTRPEVDASGGAPSVVQVVEKPKVAPTEDAETKAPVKIKTPVGGSERISEAGGMGKGPYPHERLRAGEGEKSDYEKMKEEFGGLLTEVADRLTKYRDTGKKLSLTQARFLEVMQKGGLNLDNIRDLGSAGLVLQEESFLRLGRLGKEVEAIIMGKLSPEEMKALEVQGVEASGVKGWYLRLIENFIRRGLVKPAADGTVEFKLDQIMKNLGGKLKTKIVGRVEETGVMVEVRDLGLINIENLPDEYKEYIKWLRPQVNLDDTLEFLKKAGEVRYLMYEALGYDPAEIGKTSPWAKLFELAASTTSGAFRDAVRMDPVVREQFLASLEGKADQEWVKLIIGSLDRQLGEATPAELADPKKLSEFYFKAQSEAIDHMLGAHLEETAKKPREGVLTAWDDGIKRLEDSEERGKLRTEWQTELDKKRGELDEAEKALAKLKDEDKPKKGREKSDFVAKEKPGLVQQQGRLEGLIKHWDGEVKRLTDMLGKAGEGYNRKIADASTEKEREELRKKRDAETRVLGKGINDAQIKISEVNKELRDVFRELGKETVFDRELQEMDGKITILETRIGKNKSVRGLRKDINGLERKLKEDLEEAVKKDSAKLERSIYCFRERFEVVLSVVLAGDEEEMATLGQLTSVNPVEGEFEGYLRVLDLLFKTGMSEQPILNLKAVKELIPPQDLAEALNGRFGLGITIIGPDNIKEVFEAMQKKVTQLQLANAFNDTILPLVERRTNEVVGKIE